MMKTALLFAMFGIAALGLTSGVASAQSPYKSSADFDKYAMKLRESALMIEPKVIIPSTSRPFGVGSQYPWKRNIVTTVFWIGENASPNNPVHNHSSSWDLNWLSSYGGYDSPDASARRNFAPVSFTPKQNPFYFALPYNDVTRGVTKPEVKLVIPWYKQTFVKDGQSICHDRWIAIRNPQNNKICYAQWGDCGPFRTDHWQYVFGNETPKPNLNKGAGLDISPAVRDFLGVGTMSALDWRFVEFREIPRGPWSNYGDNNNFVQATRAGSKLAMKADAPPGLNNARGEPRVVINK
jgi:hypothetical protein